MATREMTNQEAAVEMAKQMSHFVNNLGCDEQAFVLGMLGEHLTLQQSFTRLCLRWLYALSESRYVDGRNQASVEVAKKVVGALGEYGYHLPLV